MTSISIDAGHRRFEQGAPWWITAARGLRAATSQIEEPPTLE